MRRILIIVLGVMTMINPEVHAAFDKQYESINIERSSRALDRLEEGMRVLAGEAEEAEEIEEEDRIVVKTKTGFSVITERISNFFEDRLDAIPDVIVHYRPSLETLIYHNRNWIYKSLYEPGFSQHRDLEKNDHFVHNWHQEFEIPGNRLNVSVKNDLSFDSFSADDPQSKPFAYKRNLFRGNVDFKPGFKTLVTGFYEDRYLSFLSDSDKLDETHELILGTGLTYNRSPKTQWILNYHNHLSRPPKLNKPEDIDTHFITYGVNKFVTPKILINGRAGLSIRRFENEPLHTTGDKTDFVGDFVMRYQYSPKTAFKARLQRSIVPAKVPTPDDAQHHVGDLVFSYQMTPKIKIQLSEKIRLERDRKIKTQVDPDNSDIITTKKDRRIRATTAARLEFEPKKNLSLGFQYSFYRVASQLKVDDRTVHSVTGKVEAKF